MKSWRISRKLFGTKMAASFRLLSLLIKPKYP
jgi:hypothetical protein